MSVVVVALTTTDKVKDGKESNGRKLLKRVSNRTPTQRVARNQCLSYVGMISD